MNANFNDFGLFSLNDLAERAIKLTQDFCHPTKSKDRLQDIVKIVEKNKLKYQHCVKNPTKNLRSLTTMNSIFLFNIT